MDKEGRHLDGYLHFYECNLEKKDMLYIPESFELHGYFRERHAGTCKLSDNTRGFPEAVLVYHI